MASAALDGEGSGTRRRRRPASDLSLLDIAVRLRGSDTKLAEFLERTPAAVAQWRHRRKLPALIRRLLLTEMGLRTLMEMENPWMARQFQEGRRATKLVEQTMMLVLSGDERAIREFEAYLDKRQPWRSMDWKRIFHDGIDWVRLREDLVEQRRQRQQKVSRPRRRRPRSKGARLAR